MLKVIRVCLILVLFFMNVICCEAYTFVHKTEIAIQHNTEVVGIAASSSYFAIGFVGGEIALYDSQGNFLYNILIKIGENYVFEFSKEGHLLVYPSRNESVYTISTQGELLSEAKYSHDNYHTLRENMWQTKTIGENHLIISETNFQTTVEFIGSNGARTALFVEQTSRAIFDIILAMGFALFIIVNIILLQKKVFRNMKSKCDDPPAPAVKQDENK